MARRRSDLFQPQLFLDDTLIEDTVKVQRIWHQARKYPEPVLRSEHPWEHQCPAAFGTVLYRHGRFQMWYNVVHAAGGAVRWTHHIKPRICYAESDDGVHWNKPRLGLCQTLGNTANNVVIQSKKPQGLIDDITVIDDPTDRRWPLKALYWDGVPGTTYKRRGIWTARSNDGIHWEDAAQVLPGWGDRFNAMSVKYKGKYVLYGRAPLAKSPKGRVVYRTESSDLKRWTKPQLVLAADVEDPAALEFYSLTAFDYGNLLIGSIERMALSPDRLDPEIIWSHDGGLTWRRSRTRPAFIPCGEPETFDSAWVNLTTNGPIVQHGALWFYYSGRSGAHGVSFPHNHGGIGLATLRIDGFCSLAAQETPGSVLTKPMVWPDGNMLVNIDPRRNLSSHPGHTTGELRVEVRTTANQPIKGYSAADCVPLVHNPYRQSEPYVPVIWGRERSLRRLKTKRVRLAFELRDAHLYSFKASDTRSS